MVEYTENIKHQFDDWLILSATWISDFKKLLVIENMYTNERMVLIISNEIDARNLKIKIKIDYGESGYENYVTHIIKGEKLDRQAELKYKQKLNFLGDSGVTVNDGLIGLTADYKSDTFTVPSFAIAFDECHAKEINKITFNDNMVYISDGAFTKLKNLEEVELPKRLISVSSNTFDACINLRKVDASKTQIVSVESNAFSNCVNLSQINLPDSVVEIGTAAFYKCAKLTDIELSENLLFIGNRAFQGTSITKFVMPDSVRIISSEILSYSKVEEIRTGKGLKSIPIDAFRGCNKLTHIELADGLKHIENWAFYDCYDLKEIVIPESVEKIEKLAFSNSGIRDVYMSHKTVDNLINCYDRDENWTSCRVHTY